MTGLRCFRIRKLLFCVSALSKFGADKIMWWNSNLQILSVHMTHSKAGETGDSKSQRASLGNYANMCVYTRDYENLLKTNCGNLRHRPGDPKKLLCSSKSAPVCQHEVLKKKILSYSEVMREWDETTRKIRWMSLPLDPVPRGLRWEGERVWAEKTL